MEGINYAIKFNPNFVKEDWCFEKLISEKEIDNFSFYNDSIFHESFVVLIKNVVGTSHDRYVDKTWIELIGRMKRFDKKYNKENFLKFSKSNEFKKGYSYAKYGEQFIITGGNHRNCQARFSNIDIVNTCVTEHLFDYKMYECYKYFEKELLNPKIEGALGGKYYINLPWTLTVNQKELFFTSFSIIEKFYLLYKEIKPKRIDLLFYRIFKRKKVSAIKHFNEQSDLSIIKDQIVLHKIIKNN